MARSDAHEFDAAFAEFEDAEREWRRLAAELLGTFFLVLVAAGAGMMGQPHSATLALRSPGTVSAHDAALHGPP